MARSDALQALQLKTPRHIPRTEYSASSHWSLVSRVTGLPVDEHSPADAKRRASLAFEMRGILA